ncbi:T9SS type A sorting domain-containing protein [Chryseobacterium sp. PBS4-4]|uniref:T9SS type A sorting domain-containing protein n=1 Tax=Chryseobacterium edaphi TaxID=2976532 RepID=A0ABT2W9Q7_9FLAO|nr:T9SS type A sorting domain-containing protein [Chryseobacterium edaphi]MCU7618719.1 T9SS type A sorting domain-containing protein [Chryseobacterium edaphi]
MNLKLQKLSKVSLAFLMALFSVWGWAQVSIGSLPNTYSQDFNTLSTTVNTWTNNSTLQGWYASSSLIVSDGSVNSNSCYNTGTDANTDRSIGALSTSSATHNFGVRLKNNSSQAVTSFTISFTGEQWRQNAAGTLTLGYRVSSTAITSLTTGTFTDVPLLGFAALKTGTAVAIDGNDATNRTALTATININVPAGSEIMFRWNKAGSNSPVLSVDDLTIVANPAITNTPNLSISTAQNHGTSCIGTSTNAITYTITNTSTSNADGISLVSSGANASDFVVSNLSATTITAGGTATFNVTFTPSGAGSQTGTITAASTTAGSNTAAINLTGTGIGSVSGAVSTLAESNIGTGTVRLNGNLTTLGTCPNTIEKGFVWGLSPNPTILNNSQIVSSISLGAYNYDLTGLNPNTNYYYRAYIKDSNNNYIYGVDETVTTLALANHISFGSGMPTAGYTNIILSPFVKVEALRPDNTVDNSYNGTVTLSKASGTGVVSGTLTQSFVNGVATFNNVQFSAAGNYTLYADHGNFAQITSGNINVTDAEIYAKITSIADLTDGDYIIADANDAVIATSAITNGTLVTASANASANQIINPASSTVYKINQVNGNYTIQNVSTNNYLGYNTSTDLSSSAAVSTNNQRWNITYNTTNAYFSVSNVATTTRILKYNASLGTPGFKAYTSSSALPEISLYKKVIASTTWNGIAWSNGNPSSTVNATINSDYTGAGFAAQTITVNPTVTLTINSGQTVTTWNTTNNGNIIVNDGGNFIQNVGATYTAGTGSSFVANRNSASAVNKYVFWSSPVVDQNIFTAYTLGSSATAPTYVMTYNTGTNFYDLVTNADGNFVTNSGKGYSVKVPQANAGVLFGGTNKTPNNGIVNVSLAGTTGGSNNFNLIGNPYPSNLDLTLFYNANNTAIGSTLWFWDNTTGNVTTQTGSTATNVGYATINAASGTWTEAPGTQSYNSATLNGLGSIAKIGQGFIVKSVDAGQVSFTNAMRASTAGVTLNKNLDVNAGKFWIKLTTSYGNTVTQAVTYSQNALNTYDVYDSKAMGTGSDAFYSLADAEKVIIQGKAPFNINDVVPLGTKHFENGNFTVSLAHKEGLFTNGQAIYLHDKSTGTYTDLQNQAYTFTANAGEFTNRFEIVYKLNVLATSEVQKDSFEIYRDGEDFFVRNNKNIENIEIFDAAGRKVQNIDSNSKLVRIKLESKGLYIIKAKSAGKEYSKKVIK